MEESAEQTSGGSTTSKTKLLIRLTPDEYAELRKAASEYQLPNMALLVFQAIHAGLEGDEVVGVQRKHTRSITIHVSREFKQKIQARARMYRVTQQALLHGLLFHYIRDKRRQSEQSEKEGS